MKQILLLLISFFTAAAAAQETKTLTLKDAIAYALENKAESRKARLDTENSEYQIQEVRSRALPQIIANGNLVYNPILQLSALDVGAFAPPGTEIPAGQSTVQLVPLGQKWSAVGGVSVTQTIFDQAVFTGLKAAKTTREFYQINQLLTEEQVAERVATNYYQVYLQREKLEVIDSTLKNTIRVQGIIKGQFDNGLAKKIDLDRITVNLYNLNTQRQQLLNAVQLQENSLKFYMGMPFSTQIVLPESEFEVTPLNLEERPQAENLSEYRLLSTQEKLLTFQKKSVISEYYPTLSISGGYNYIGQGPEFPLGGKPEDGVYWSDYSNISLNLRIPIFTGFGTRSRVRQADVELRRTREDLLDLKLSLDYAYENSRTQIANSLITINNQQENVKLAQQVLENTQNNYYNGLATLTDVLDSENAFVEARNNYSTALLEYKLAEIQLKKSKGELKTLSN